MSGVIKMLRDADLKPCPFCGCDKLTRSVNGGCLPGYITGTRETIIYNTYDYYMSCEIWCDRCGVLVADYAASNNRSDDLYEEAIQNTYNKWNRRALYERD